MQAEAALNVIVDAAVHSTMTVAKNETAKQSRERLSRESRLWLQGAQASGPAPANVRCVDVSDSLSDTFEYMSFERTQGRHFVLRQREDRRLQEPVAGQQYLEMAVRTLHAALEGGVRLIDTAALYLNSRSEALVARALRERPDLAADVGDVEEAQEHPCDHQHDQAVQGDLAQQERPGVGVGPA